MKSKALQICTLILSSVAIPAAMAQTSAAHNGVRFTASSENVSGAGEAIKINLTGWSTDAQRDELVNAWTLKPAPASATPEGRGGRGARGGAGARGARGGRGPAAAAPAADVPADPDAVDPDNPAFRFGRGGARGRGADGPAVTPQAALTTALKKSPTIGVLWTSETVGYSIKYAYRMPQPDGSERIVLATDRRVGTWSNLWKPSGAITPPDTAFSIIELHLNAKGEGEGKGVLAGKIGVDAQTKTLALDDYATLPVILKSVKRQAGN